MRNQSKLMVLAVFTALAVVLVGCAEIVAGTYCIARGGCGGRDGAFTVPRDENSASEPLWPEPRKDVKDRADQGHSSAQFAYATNYAKGQERIDYLCRAGKQGHQLALLSLARVRQEGDHFPDAPVTADPVRAYMWYTLSHEKAFYMAEEYRNDLSKTMTPAQIAEAERLAAEWTPESPCPSVAGATATKSPTPVRRSTIAPIDPGESSSPDISRSCTNPAFADLPQCREWLAAWNAAHAEGRTLPSPTEPLQANISMPANPAPGD